MYTRWCVYKRLRIHIKHAKRKLSSELILLLALRIPSIETTTEERERSKEKRKKHTHSLAIETLLNFSRILRHAYVYVYVCLIFFFFEYRRHQADTEEHVDIHARLHGKERNFRHLIDRWNVAMTVEFANRGTDRSSTLVDLAEEYSKSKSDLHEKTKAPQYSLTVYLCHFSRQNNFLLTATNSSLK